MGEQNSVRLEVRDINRGFILSQSIKGWGSDSELVNKYDLNTPLYLSRVWSFTDSNNSLVDDYVLDLFKVFCTLRFRDTGFSMDEVKKRVLGVSKYVGEKYNSTVRDSLDEEIDDIDAPHRASVEEGLFGALVYSSFFTVKNINDLSNYLNVLIRSIFSFVTGEKDELQLPLTATYMRVPHDVKRLAYFIILGCVLGYFQ